MITRSVELSVAEEERPHAPGDGQRVYILARKVLLRNTRIFKQASSLTDAGYEVTVVGILPRNGERRERRDGYTILRVKLDPIYVSVPRRVRRALRAIDRVILRAPGQYLRAALRARRRIRGLRRRVRLAGYAVRRRARAARMVLRRRMYAAGHARRIRLLRIRQRWRALDYHLRRPLHRAGIWLHSARTAIVARAASFGRWVSGAVAGGDEAPSPHSWLTRVVAIPLVLLARAVQRCGALAAAALGSVRRVPDRIRGQSIIYSVMRTLSLGVVRALRTVEEFLIACLSWLLRRFTWPLKSLNYYKLVYRTVTQELEPPDVIHANDLDTLLVAVLLARRYGVPLVYDAQELYVGMHTLPRWYRLVLTWQERFLIRRVDRITVVNDAIAEVMARKYRVRIDSVVLNCPPMQRGLAPAGGMTIRQELGVPDEEIVLLYSGALTPRRGLENTVLALEHLERVSLVILGEGPLREQLQDLAVEHGLGERIFFAGFVHHLDVPWYIASADIGIIPYERVGINHYLCSPSKLFHYIMAELPVVCSDFPFLRTVVLDNGLGGVFDPSDARSIAGAVRRLVETTDERAAVKERLRAIKSRYCWEEQEQRFLAVYSSLAVNGGLSGPAESPELRARVRLP